jgi:hypothetical protein
MGYSCAREIAEKYGITFEQLRQALAGKGVTDGA